MRTIEYARKFRRDFIRELSGRHRETIDHDIRSVVALLCADEPLPYHYYDHALKGKWRGMRDCHLKPDLVLIYEKPDKDSLRLVRLGSHSELGV